MKILFICKKNETYGFTTYTRRSSGLYNSTQFIIHSLRKRDVDAKIVEVIDNNDIDREVTSFKPDVVIIEALWVVPDKFPELFALHPGVKWYCHLHSHMPFLALEGIAIEWMFEYVRLGIGLVANSVSAYKSLRTIFSREALVYLPNIYISHPRHPRKRYKVGLDIGCFGAVRPLKNQLIQALAAIRFAKEKGEYLRFHINSTRTETGGDPVLKNIRSLFELEPEAELVETEWHETLDFLNLLQRMDVGMQVSLTETFNVVTADYVTAGIPVVVSKEVAWVSFLNKAIDDSVDGIVHHMHRAYRWRWIVTLNQFLLVRHSKRAQKRWFDFVEECR